MIQPMKCFGNFSYPSSVMLNIFFPLVRPLIGISPAPLIAQLLSSVLKLYSFVYFGQSLTLESMLSWSKSYVSFDPNYIPITSQRARKSMD